MAVGVLRRPTAVNSIWITFTCIGHGKEARDRVSCLHPWDTSDPKTERPEELNPSVWPTERARDE